MSRDLASVVRELQTCETADDVADLLRSANARGLRGSPWRCPVAAYVRRRLADPTLGLYDVAVGHHIRVRRERLSTPPAVVSFVRDFDERGSYRDLVELDRVGW